MIMQIKSMILTAQDQLLFFSKTSFWEKRETIKFLALMGLTLLGYRKKINKSANHFFNLQDLPGFSQEIKKAVFFDLSLAKSILNPKHKGIKAWEYGLFISTISLKKGQKILDVGSGSCALPFLLSSIGANVTAFDQENPEELPNGNLLSKYPHVSYHQGTMLKLPYNNNSFDLVLCLSSIEHLSIHQEKSLPYSLFLENTQKALREMVRVLKPKGRLFLTSDLYIPALQKNDRWPQATAYPRIVAAYEMKDFSQIFLDLLTQLKCSLVGKPDFNFADLMKDINRCIYRGRYFTTFSLYAKKNP